MEPPAPEGASPPAADPPADAAPQAAELSGVPPPELASPAAGEPGAEPEGGDRPGRQKKRRRWGAPAADPAPATATSPSAPDAAEPDALQVPADGEKPTACSGTKLVERESEE